jgi:hypothetical protein
MVILLILEYLIFVCHKRQKVRETPSVLQLLDFHHQEVKNTLPEFKKIEFINYTQNRLDHNLKTKKKCIVVYKIKDLLLKCYPQLIGAYKNGYSIRKILGKYDINNLPTFEKSKKF